MVRTWLIEQMPEQRPLRYIDDIESHVVVNELQMQRPQRTIRESPTQSTNPELSLPETDNYICLAILYSILISRLQDIQVAGSSHTPTSSSLILTGGFANRWPCFRVVLCSDVLAKTYLSLYTLTIREWRGQKGGIYAAMGVKKFRPAKDVADDWGKSL